MIVHESISTQEIFMFILVILPDREKGWNSSPLLCVEMFQDILEKQHVYSHKKGTGYTESHVSTSETTPTTGNDVT